MSNIEEIANNVLNEFGLEGKAIYISPDTINISLHKKYFCDSNYTKELLDKREDLVNSLKMVNKIKYRVVIDLEPLVNE